MNNKILEESILTLQKRIFKICLFMKENPKILEKFIEFKPSEKEMNVLEEEIEKELLK